MLEVLFTPFHSYLELFLWVDVSFDVELGKESQENASLQKKGLLDIFVQIKSEDAIGYLRTLCSSPLSHSGFHPSTQQLFRKAGTFSRFISFATVQAESAK